MLRNWAAIAATAFMLCSCAYTYEGRAVPTSVGDDRHDDIVHVGALHLGVTAKSPFDTRSEDHLPVMGMGHVMNQRAGLVYLGEDGNLYATGEYQRFNDDPGGNHLDGAKVKGTFRVGSYEKPSTPLKPGDPVRFRLAEHCQIIATGPFANHDYGLVVMFTEPPEPTTTTPALLR